MRMFEFDVDRRRLAALVQRAGMPVGIPWESAALPNLPKGARRSVPA